jgi:hypothetical protein
MRWTRAFQLLGLLALLANAAFLPFVHVGLPGALHHAEASQAHHHDGQKEPTGATHQVCHFCRLVGVALPPPPTTIIEIVAVSEAVAWPTHQHAILPQPNLRKANRPRGPPLSV